MTCSNQSGGGCYLTLLPGLGGDRITAQDGIQRVRYTVRLERLNEKMCVPELATRPSTEETSHLSLELLRSPRRLSL